jgi:hypothetical protein
MMVDTIKKLQKAEKPTKVPTIFEACWFIKWAKPPIMNHL